MKHRGHAEADVDAAVLAAVVALAHYGLAELPDVRAALPDLPHATVTASLRRLERAQRISLSIVNNAYGLDASQGIDWPGRGLVWYAAPR